MADPTTQRYGLSAYLGSTQEPGESERKQRLLERNQRLLSRYAIPRSGLSRVPFQGPTAGPQPPNSEIEGLGETRLFYSPEPEAFTASYNPRLEGVEEPISPEEPAGLTLTRAAQKETAIPAEPGKEELKFEEVVSRLQEEKPPEELPEGLTPTEEESEEELSDLDKSLGLKSVGLGMAQMQAGADAPAFNEMMGGLATAAGGIAQLTGNTTVGRTVSVLGTLLNMRGQRQSASMQRDQAVGFQNALANAIKVGSGIANAG